MTLTNDHDRDHRQLPRSSPVGSHLWLLVQHLRLGLRQRLLTQDWSSLNITFSVIKVYTVGWNSYYTVTKKLQKLGRKA